MKENSRKRALRTVVPSYNVAVMTEMKLRVRRWLGSFFQETESKWTDRQESKSKDVERGAVERGIESSRGRKKEEIKKKKDRVRE